MLLPSPRISTVAIALLACVGLWSTGVAPAQAARFDPPRGPVKIRGGPWYVELARTRSGRLFGTAGGGISDYGSRSAIKASLVQPRPLLAASYASFGALGRKLDRSAIDLITATGKRIQVRRSVNFAPWGWMEHIRGRGVAATGAAYTIARDAFAFTLRIRASRSVRARLVSFSPAGIDEALEAFNPFEGGSDYSVASGRRGGDRFRIARRYPHGNSAGTIVWRTWRLRGLRVSRGESRPSGFKLTALSPPRRGRYTVAAVVGVGLGRGQSDRAARKGLQRNPGRALGSVRADWRRFLTGPGRPPAGISRSARVGYARAMTALRMNLVAPFGRMRRPGTVPAKVAWPQFFGWDTPLNALGMAEWGGWRPSWLRPSGFTLAEDMVLLQLDAQTPQGQICFLMGEDLRCQQRQWIQMPVQGWTAWQVAQRDSDRARARRFTRTAYARLARFFDYVVTTHDGADGRLQAYGAAETWDDNPRASLKLQSWLEFGVKQPDYEPVELPVWMNAYADAMARMAKMLGLTSDVHAWHRQARRLAEETDGHWDHSVGGWLDRRAGTLVDVRTPILWWPAAFGVGSAERALRAVNKHALNPAESWGFTPTPSSAVNSAFYDRAEHGSYWQGQAWVVLAYGTLMALERTGHHVKAEQLRTGLLRLAGSHGGIYEAYDAVTGDVGFGPGAQIPAGFGYGWSAALTAAAAHRRYVAGPMSGRR